MNQKPEKEDVPHTEGAGSYEKGKTYSGRAYVRYALLLFGVLAVLGAVFFSACADRQAGEKEVVSRQPEGMLWKPGMGAETDDVLEGKVGEASLEVPESGMRQVCVTSCEILPDEEQFVLRGEAAELPDSDDDYFYLFALEVYEEELQEGEEYIARTRKDVSFELAADVNRFQANSRLYQKFVVAILKDGRYEALTAPRYITNPEALADYQEPFPEAESIKGLLVDPQNLGTTELDELGVNHAVYNIPVARLLGPSTMESYPTITYTYKGKEYFLNGHVVSEYDYVFSTLTKKGIVITAILLNNRSEAYMNLIHPMSRDKNANYYAFNAADESGAEYLEAIASFLAERYRDREHGVVMNWIVGNEINVRSQWNYMQYVDIKTYVREYARAFRICYNAIKSMNANARVYISLDQQWNMELTSNTSYNSRDILDEFNALISREGNIGWGLAHHPYSVPLNWPKFWDLSAQNAELVKESEDSAMVIIYNIDVVTDYMQRKEFLTPEGQVRPIILSEMGFTSTYGEDVQAAAFAYAYYIAANNQYIDAMILSRETDAVEEVAQGLALGLSYQNGRKKLIYDTFKYIDTDKAEEYTEFARRYIGIEDWDEVITSR